LGRYSPHRSADPGSCTERYKRKKKLAVPGEIPDYPLLSDGEEQLTILLCGTHENNTDTIILLHADAAAQTITLISLPRDLYYRGKKINDIFKSFGSDYFRGEISKITGVQIDKYIIIDMFAFIDAVNILGGIDVTLDEDLIDPTYKVRDHGVWGTLYYKKGTYHVNGIEALRIARARHYTPLFSRDTRQQKIIVALKDKLEALDVSEMGKIYDLVKVMMEYVDTNFTPFELVNAFLKYRSISSIQQNVLSTSNVLYQTYSNLYLLEETESIVDESINKGAWILLPRDNNWDLIKWYTRNSILGENNG
jgi:LCP family protein required for cell wall assembly